MYSKVPKRSRARVPQAKVANLGLKATLVALALVVSAGCEDEEDKRLRDASASSSGSQDASASDSASADVAVQAAPSATGTVSPFSPRDVSRQAHAIVQLADGTVLVSGGVSFGRPLSGLVDSAVYDLKSASLTVVGRMQDGRHSHSATLLADGRVLIAGGYGGTPPAEWRTAELYDPAARTFMRAAGAMSIPRVVHGAFRLSTGALAAKVLVIGGGALGSPMTVEMFDPATSTFTTVTTIGAPAERGNQAFALLADESVLVIGGRTVANTPPTLEAYVYVPATATFRRVGDALEGRHNPTATTLVDGRVLVVGGQSGPSGSGPELATSELYDPALERFSPGPVMSIPRRNHTAARLGSGRIVIAGGNPSSSTTTNSTELFTPGADTFTKGANMGQALALVESLSLADGRALLSGGQGMTGLVNRGVELFSD